MAVRPCGFPTYAIEEIMTERARLSGQALLVAVLLGLSLLAWVATGALSDHHMRLGVVTETETSEMLGMPIGGMTHSMAWAPFMVMWLEALEKAGGKRPIICDSSWSSDQWSFAGMEEFPNIEAVQYYMAAADELNLFRYVEATSVLGTKMEP
jgi:hypothetical protein